MKWLILSIVLNITAASADLYTTHKVIESGRHELNPIMRNTYVRYPLKVGLTLTFSGFSIKEWKKGNHKNAILMNVIPTSLSTTAAIWNRHQY